MTREEAITKLKIYRDYLCKMSSVVDVNEVAKPINMAIEALEQPIADVVPLDFHERCLEAEIRKQANMVEVVRCEECRYWDNRFDVMVCNLTDGMKGASDYCSFGERKILPKL